MGIRRSRRSAQRRAQLEQAREQYAAYAFEVRTKEDAPGFISLRIHEMATDRWAEVELGTADVEVLQQLLAAELKTAKALGLWTSTFGNYFIEPRS